MDAKALLYLQCFTRGLLEFAVLELFYRLFEIFVSTSIRDLERGKIFVNDYTMI